MKNINHDERKNDIIDIKSNNTNKEKRISDDILIIRLDSPIFTVGSAKKGKILKINTPTYSA